MGSDGGLMRCHWIFISQWLGLKPTTMGLEGGLPSGNQTWLENPAINGGFYPRLPPKGDAKNISKQ